MPTLEVAPKTKILKMLLLGDSGTAKTGCLASLVNVLGKKLLILDYDNGLPVLHAYVKPELLGNVYYETLTDKRKHSGQGKMGALGEPKAFMRGMDILSDGKLYNGDGTFTKLGDPAALGADWVVVIDSLSTASRAAHLYVNTIAPSRDGRMDYHNTQQQIIGMLAHLHSDHFQTHVIVIAHVDYYNDQESMTLDEDGNPQFQLRGGPRSIGKAIIKEIPAYFNVMVRAKTTGSGVAMRRVIRTVAEGIVDLKNTKPTVLKPELPVDTGLATIFSTLLE